MTGRQLVREHCWWAPARACRPRRRWRVERALRHTMIDVDLPIYGTSRQYRWIVLRLGVRLTGLEAQRRLHPDFQIATIWYRPGIILNGASMLKKVKIETSQVQATCDVVYQAGVLLLKGQANVSWKLKKDGTFVTALDLRTQRFIKAKL